MRQPLMTAGAVLGFGAGGFFDGILLHQLLQWHHLVSERVPATTLEGLQLNTLWDGIFHSAMYVIVVVGLVLTWRAVVRHDVPASPRVLFGAALLGMGIFHVFDSIVNHWLLGIHHIRSGPDWLVYDLAFFALGLVFMAGGWALSRAR
jgi:uncharacterized membrane protein